MKITYDFLNGIIEFSLNDESYTIIRTINPLNEDATLLSSYIYEIKTKNGYIEKSSLSIFDLGEYLSSNLGIGLDDVRKILLYFFEEDPNKNKMLGFKLYDENRAMIQYENYMISIILVSSGIEVSIVDLKKSTSETKKDVQLTDIPSILKKLEMTESVINHFTDLLREGMSL